MLDSPNRGHQRSPGKFLSRPLANPLLLSAGDFLAKTVSFLAFAYLARVLGAGNYGTLEFASSLVMYFLLAADAGVETWAVREIASGAKAAELAGRVQAVRLANASLSFCVLLAALPLLPPFPLIRMLALLFGASLFVQALSLKWYFMGQQRMRLVGSALVGGQLLFGAVIFAFVRDPEHLLYVPIARLVSEGSLAIYFGYRFRGETGVSPLVFHGKGGLGILASALTLGAANALALVNYNFDAILLGYLTTAEAVGCYGVAYKLILVALAPAVSYFLGIFPVLSRAHASDLAEFQRLANRSLRNCALYAVPVAVSGYLLAEPLMLLVFGEPFLPSVPSFQILIWSAALVVMRGTYRQGLTAAHFHKYDLVCAISAASVNIILNFVLIPRYGLAGAAVATLISEMVWFSAAWFLFSRLVFAASLSGALWRPALSGLAMWIAISATPFSLFPRAFVGGLAYVGALVLLGEHKSWSGGLTK